MWLYCIAFIIISLAYLGALPAKTLDATSATAGVFDVTLSGMYMHRPRDGNQYYDAYYLMEVAIGSPSQTFAVGHGYC